MIASIFTVLFVQPVFNVLVFIYGVLPGHNFGLAIVLFTILVRVILWPLLKKQLHQSIKMRALQPELKKVKQAAKGNRQKQSQLMMALYKERGINPFSSIGVMILQLPILLSLYAGLRRIIDDPNQIVSFAYPVLQHLPSISDLAGNIHLFDNTLFGLVDLSKTALSGAGIYWPAMIIVIGSAAVQFFQSRQLMPVDKDARKLRVIMKEASATGKSADQAEVSAAISKTMIYVFPVMILMIGVSLPAALAVYWLVSSAVALTQQSIILRRDSEELIKAASGGKSTRATVTNQASKDQTSKAKEPGKPSKAASTKGSVTIKKNGKVITRNVDDIPEAEVTEVPAAAAANQPSKPKPNAPKPKSSSKSTKKAKRRKR